MKSRIRFVGGPLDGYATEIDAKYFATPGALLVFKRDGAPLRHAHAYELTADLDMDGRHVLREVPISVVDEIVHEGIERVRLPGLEGL